MHDDHVEAAEVRHGDDGPQEDAPVLVGAVQRGQVVHVCAAYGVSTQQSQAYRRKKITAYSTHFTTQIPLTIKHILLKCVDFTALRQQFYTAGGILRMHEFYIKVKQENISALLRAAGLYHLI